MATRDDEGYTLIANSDLSAKEGCFGKLVAGKADVCSVLGEQSHFVIEQGGVAGAGVGVAPRAGKKVQIKVGAVAVAANAELTPDANGLAKTAVSTNNVRALALVAGNAGVTIECLWVDQYIKP